MREVISSPSGTLYVVSTPIGNPDDITIRALATLRRVMVVASEDPRATQALLDYHGITATVTSYGPFNRHEKAKLLLSRLMQGQDIALVSDNGTPIIFDPGSLLVAAAHHSGVPVKSIPGPSTLTAAAAVSGFSGDAIIFEGHLPTTPRHLTRYLSKFLTERSTLVAYVDPKNLTGLLKLLAQLFPARQLAVAIDLTTSREKLFRGRPGDLVKHIGPTSKNAAVTVVIEGDTVTSHEKK